MGCGHKIGELDSFCTQCGAKKAQFVPSLKRAKTRIIDSAQSLPKKVQEVSQEGVSQFADSFRELWVWPLKLLQAAKARPIRSSALVLVGLYALVFVSSFVWLSPKMFISEYLTAVSEKRVSALADTAFFPRDEGVEVASQVLLDAISVKSGGYVIESDWTPISWESFANVVWLDGEEQAFSVSPRVGFLFGFMVRDWQMVQNAPVVTLNSLAGASPDQQIALGQRKFAGIDDGEFQNLLNSPVVMFPGTLSIRYFDYGFAAGEVKSVEIPRVGIAMEIPIGPEYSSVPPGARGVSLDEVEAFASSCARTECRELPYFFDYEFSWDDSSREYKSFYDSKFESTSYAASECESVGLTASGPLAATIQFSCLISATRMETYVTYYYYISDDYDFYFGSASKPMLIEAKMNFNPVSNVFEVDELKMGDN